MIKPFRSLLLEIAGCFLLLLSLCVTPSGAMMTKQEIVKQAQFDGVFGFKIEDCDLPCENSGHCVSFDSDGDGILDPQCLCPSNYTGTLCESPRPCSLPCENNGSCVIEDAIWQYFDPNEVADFVFLCLAQKLPGCESDTCVCKGNFYGELCERSCNCENGGTCQANPWDEPPDAQHRCQCEGNFYGERCEKECSKNCANAGKCMVFTDEDGEVKEDLCLCEPGFEGPTCEVVKPCDRPCENGSTCQFSRPFSNDYWYSHYDSMLDEIQSSGCDSSNFTSCFGDSSSYCECARDQVGELCELTCESNCLNNGGSCALLSNSTGCICRSGFSGPSCEFECSLDCSNGGHCVSDGATEFCVCQPTWEGTTCEIRKPCDLQCNNGGSCEFEFYFRDDLSIQYCLLDEYSSYCPGRKDDEYKKCECTPEWSGPDCSDPCPCQNGGSCSSWRRRRQLQVEPGTTPNGDDAWGSYYSDHIEEDTHYCVCPFGFTGENCEKKVDGGECSISCQNGGYCFSAYHGFHADDDDSDSCICDRDKFDGEFCEIKKDEQQLEDDYDDCFGICLNGGTCNQGSIGPRKGGNRNLVQAQSGFPQISCTCPEGISGPFCERKPCGSGYCGYGAACIELPSGETTAAGDDFVCDCMVGVPAFVGPVIGRQCDAPAESYCDFGGDDNPNEPWACSNGGRCYYSDSDPSCYCPSGFTGPRCEYDTNDATDMVWSVCNLPCQNGGICLKGPNKPIAGIFMPFLEITKKAGLFDYPRTKDFEYCYCPEGFFGVECDKQYELCGDRKSATEEGTQAQVEHICFHGSKCQRSSDDDEWSCDCDGTLSAGPFCQYESTDTCGDEDATTFCVNGGTCNLGSDPVCSCLDGWEGSRCEIDPSAPALTDNGEGKGASWSGAGTIDGTLLVSLLAIIGVVL